MMRRSAILVAAATVLTACGGLAATRGRPVAGPTPTSSPSGGGIEFVLEESYPEGAVVRVAITNTGTRGYRYNASGYEACNLTYRDDTGREFIIPPGTHCDLIIDQTIVPKETVTLFRWRLEECVVDDWGCVESETLPPGMYTIEGTFRAAGGGPPAHAEATFEILPAG